MKASDYIFDKDLPPEQALQELKLNLTEQYGRLIAYLYVDSPISLYVLQIVKQNLIDNGLMFSIKDTQGIKKPKSRH